MSSPRARGQSLLLFALTLLLLTLMVLVTLQTGMRARERVEAQMVADAAAYSQAVVTARTYNTIAVMNRAAMAHYVALLGTESLISWSGQMRGGGAGLLEAVEGCPDGALLARRIRARLDASNFVQAWELYDSQAGVQAREHQGNGGIKGQAAELHEDTLLGQLISGQKLAKSIAQRANPELTAAPGGDAKALAELSSDCTTGATCSSGDHLSALSAVMGSRGWTFTTARTGATAVLAAALQAEAAAAGVPLGVAVTASGEGGGSGFGGDPYYGRVEKLPRENSQTIEEMTGESAWAEDHAGSVTVTLGACVRTVAVNAAWVMSSAKEIKDDIHHYNGGQEKAALGPLGKAGPPEEPEVRHTLGSCPLTRPGCPGVFGSFFTYNASQLFEPGNDFGQPKLYALLSRDYRARVKDDPWALFFRFKMSGTSPFDNGSKDGALATPGGVDLSKQGALSAGLVYYHRPWQGGDAGGFHEPPNLYNPFWRATLAAPDADAPDRLRAAGFKDAGDALAGLLAAGFKGTR